MAYVILKHIIGSHTSITSITDSTAFLIFIVLFTALNPWQHYNITNCMSSNLTMKDAILSICKQMRSLQFYLVLIASYVHAKKQPHKQFFF